MRQVVRFNHRPIWITSRTPDPVSGSTERIDGAAGSSGQARFGAPSSHFPLAWRRFACRLIGRQVSPMGSPDIICYLSSEEGKRGRQPERCRCPALSLHPLSIDPARSPSLRSVSLAGVEPRRGDGGGEGGTPKAARARPRSSPVGGRPLPGRFKERSVRLGRASARAGGVVVVMAVSQGSRVLRRCRTPHRSPAPWPGGCRRRYCTSRSATARPARRRLHWYRS